MIACSFAIRKMMKTLRYNPHWKQDYLNTQVALSDGGTKGTVAALAGWELFEDQIQNRGTQVNPNKQVIVCIILKVSIHFVLSIIYYE